MATFQIFGMGFILMIVCITLGILMSFAGGTVIDSLTMGKTGDLLTNSSHMSTGFKTAQDNTIWIFINMYYGFCYLLPVLGIVIFIQSIMPKTSGDRYV
jgi:hypothetical protein